MSGGVGGATVPDLGSHRRRDNDLWSSQLQQVEETRASQENQR
jgi:hypothetical protein